MLGASGLALPALGLRLLSLGTQAQLGQGLLKRLGAALAADGDDAATKAANIIISVGAITAIFGIVQYGILDYDNLIKTIEKRRLVKSIFNKNKPNLITVNFEVTYIFI